MLFACAFHVMGRKVFRCELIRPLEIKPPFRDSTSDSSSKENDFRGTSEQWTMPSVVAWKLYTGNHYLLWPEARLCTR